MKEANAVGFDNLDNLFVAYYCASFSGTSPLATQQRLSRQRRLPNVLAEVLKSSERWTQSERQSFHEEIQRAGQALARSETSAVRGIVRLGIGHLLIQHQPAHGPLRTEQVLDDMEELLRNEVALTPHEEGFLLC